MLKSIVISAFAVALGAAASLLMCRHEALAQTAPLYVNVVDLQVASTSMSKLLAALETDGTASVKEAGVREIAFGVPQKPADHVYIFEVYDNAAALSAHDSGVNYLKFVTTTMSIIRNYNIRPFSSVAMNTNATAQPASGSLVVNQEEFDIAPAQLAQFEAAAKTNAAASVQDAGCREFDIAVSQTNPNHLLFFEVYNNADALKAQLASDHNTAFQTATKGMASNPSATQLSSVEVNVKPQ
jgi:quinol monooxygenase YgiN